jgi:hypothetical protein
MTCATRARIGATELLIALTSRLRAHAPLTLMQFRAFAVSALVLAGCLSSQQEQLPGDAAGDSRTDSAAPRFTPGQTAGSRSPLPQVDASTLRANCLARPIDECSQDSACEVYWGNAGKPGCPQLGRAAFCGLRKGTCGLRLYCARDLEGAVWLFGDSCGAAEALQLGWRWDVSCYPCSGADCEQSDDAGVDDNDAGLASCNF